MERMPRNNSSEQNTADFFGDLDEDFLNSISLTATRRERNRSFEADKRYRAAEWLSDPRVGLLKRMDSIELYHGRAKSANETETWQVNPSLDNSGDKTGNKNINKVPALNTSTRETAQKFAKARAKNGTESELHRIVSDNPDARIIDESFNWNRFSKDEIKKIKSAIYYSLPTVAEGVTLDFSDRKLGLGSKVNIAAFHSPESSEFLFEKDVGDLADKLDASINAVVKVGGARNTESMLKYYPDKFLQSLIRAYRKDEDFVSVNYRDSGEQRIPISREYIGTWLKNMDVVGAKTQVNSGTIHETIDNYLLYELDDINTPEALEKKRTERNRQFGRIAIKNFELNHNAETEVSKKLLYDPYAKPEELVALAKETPGFKKLFEGSAGVWEGFSVEQHTETVLRVFEDNFADKIPETILPLMRTVLLVHDIGKAESAEKGEKWNQKKYNIPRAIEFMKANGFDSRTQKLITSMIGDGADLTSNWVVHKEMGAEQVLDGFCRKTMMEYLGGDITEDDVAGFKNLLLTLQTCDSAAYTDMALTRSRDGNYRYKNFPQFNKSFRRKAGLNNRKLELKTGED